MLLSIRNEIRSASTAYVSTIAAKSIPFESSEGFLPTSMIPAAAALPCAIPEKMPTRPMGIAAAKYSRHPVQQ